jgi:hypothetical protein
MQQFWSKHGINTKMVDAIDEYAAYMSKKKSSTA